MEEQENLIVEQESIDVVENEKGKINFILEVPIVRKEQKVTQKKLEILSGIKQPMIARIEKGLTIPRIDTFLKLIKPLGLTLEMVPLKENVEE